MAFRFSLILQHFIGSFYHGVVEQRAASGLQAEVAAGGRVDVRQDILELLARTGERLADQHGHVELHDERLVFGLAQNLIQKAKARRALGFEHAPLAHAGVDHQADGQGQIGFLGKIADGLRAAALEEYKIFLGEIADDFVFLGPHGSQHVDHFHSGGESGYLLAPGQ